MAIAFAHPEYVGRTSGANACCKSAYNARGKIEDIKTGVVYNWQRVQGNVYHDILLPSHVDVKFKNVAILANEVERAENRKDSQLYVEWLLALPKEDEITLDMKKEIVQEFIDRKGWVKEGLGVQIDIHAPHEGDVNWHAHLLVTTRRFTKNGLGLEVRKAVDLQPEVKFGKVQKTPEIDNHIFYRDVLNDKFKGWGLELRADLPGEITQEHVGPVRMRSVLNAAAERNEQRRLAEIEHLSTGEAIVNKVARHISVFSRGDLVRAVKYVNDFKLREKLVEEAITSQSLIALHKEDGVSLQYYTTKAIRAEEEKVLRLCSYVANGSNVFNSSRKVGLNTRQLILEHSSNLTEEQRVALTEALTSESALHIIRGRAGTGKSHVLRKIASIAKESNINVIGLAPTYKAKEALSSDGFTRTDTVKGMLFKLHNARFSLPSNSLLVVDEAGMIGNDDFSELLRVAATLKCTVILSGDERQLASVQRGGMFQIFADKYGSSTILRIKRQDSEWGKAVAMAFSEGDVVGGVYILEQEGRIKWQADEDLSMQELLSDWHKSSYDIDNKIILAVKNKDVAALNHGVRQYLKGEGVLTGPEIEVAGNHYMKGDRILIRKTNKDLGIINGDLGEILEVSKNRFVVAMRKAATKTDTGAKADTDTNVNANTNTTSTSTKVIEFDPAKYSGFRHGYATTIFMAQGISIKAVYFLHNGFTGLRNSYVALSRNISELNLYVNHKLTAGVARLIRQLSYDPEAGSSLNYLTQDEARDSKEKGSKDNVGALKNTDIGLFDGMLLGAYNFVERNITKLTDKYLPKSEYYNYQEPAEKKKSVEYVLDKVYEQNQQIESQHIANQYTGFALDGMEERMVVGGNVSNIRVNSSASYRINNVSNLSNLGNLDNISNFNLNGSSLDKDNGIGGNELGNNKLGDNGVVKDKDLATVGSAMVGNSIAPSPLVLVTASTSSAATNSTATTFTPPSSKLSKQSAKERFYARADYLRNGEQHTCENIQRYKDEYRAHIDRLRGELRFSAESVALSLLGQPNKKLSTKSTLKYGNKGSLVVRISGTKAGTWYDFEQGEGGDLLGLVQREKNCDFKESVDYLSDSVGLSRGRSVNIVHLHSVSDRYVDYHKEQAKDKAEEAAKIKKAENLYGRSKVIDRACTASRYLVKTRKIDFEATSYKIGSDIRTATIYEKSLDKRLPAIIAFARDVNGNITGGQHLLLDSKSLGKAVVPVPRKSFGKIAGSFVDLGTFSYNNANKGKGDNVLEELEVRYATPDLPAKITIIAEGLETGLSVKQALSRGSNYSSLNIKVLCSLGISNIGNYQPIKGEKIIIAADNDGEQSVTSKTIDAAKMTLESRGGYVEIVTPDKAGDFNDMLISGTEHDIQNAFSLAINKYMATSLNKYVAICNQTINSITLDNHEKENLAYIQKYNLPEHDIIDGYRKDHATGTLELEGSRRSLESAANYYKLNRDILFEAQQWGYNTGEVDATKAILGMDEVKANSFCKKIRDNHLGEYLDQHLNDFTRQKQSSYKLEELKTIMVSEQKFLKDTYQSLKFPIDQYHSDYVLYTKLQAAEISAKQPEILNEIFVLADKLFKEYSESETNIYHDMSFSVNTMSVHKELETTIAVKKQFRQPEKQAEARLHSTSVELALAEIQKEQNMLADLYGNIKYFASDKELMSKVELAYTQRENKDFSQLEILAKESLAIGAEKPETLLKKLQQTTDLRATYQTLDKIIQEHKINNQVAISLSHINGHLAKLDTQKQEANTPAKVMGVIKQEQEFLAELHGNIKYPDRHSDKLINSINSAHNNIQSNKVGQLNKFVNFLEKSSIASSVITTLKDVHNPQDAYETLLTRYQSRCLETIQLGLDRLKTENSIIADNKKFTCAMKFLEHVTKTRNHEYFPYKEVQKIQSKVIENHKQLQISKGLEMEL